MQNAFSIPIQYILENLGEVLDLQCLQASEIKK